ncbi:carbohydrate ABC transporter permease [Paenibacillus sp. ACRSA]|uniref:carbohydrate ABC transporter permease n=1 Tax=Paenibacillus sp. ACRSA TaxID=2918211 RepID=UPI001EF4FF03|nr:carbohydrate ABC transporter permease [Paenibacillus sp. ACRSA]MCG7378852.1 carbohydrate ABC transporter permease [Paenibacillus sp. ACRSA]
MKRKNVQHIKRIILFLGLGFMAILFLMPMILTVSSSLMTEQEITYHYQAMLNPGSDKEHVSDTISLSLVPESMTTDQYAATISDSTFLKRFWNSVILVVPITVLQIIISLFAAYGFARYDDKIKRIVFFIFITLMLMPNQVMLVPNYLVGQSIGIEGSRWMVILPGVFSVFPIYLLTRTMRRIPKSYFEAAKLDGAGEVQIFRYVVLPMCKSMIVSVLLLVFIDYWNMVEQPLLFLNPEQQPLSLYLSRTGNEHLGQTFAAAVLYMIPPLLLFLYGRKDLSRGISYAGNKE